MKVHNPNRFTTPPDAVLFDLDNTLYAYDPAHNAALKAVEHKVITSLSTTSGEFHSAFANAKKSVKQSLKRTASSHNRLIYFQVMLEQLGLGSQALLSLDLEQTYWRTFLENATLFEGVFDTLDTLRLNSIPVALVTDLTAQIQFRKVVYFDLDEYFDTIVTSEETGEDKPYPANFNLALEKLQPAGSNFWMIGDSPRKDIVGARDSIGATGIQKLHRGVHEGTGDERGDATFTSFRLLNDFILRMPND